jgi:hypothetical protein
MAETCPFEECRTQAGLDYLPGNPPGSGRRVEVKTCSEGRDPPDRRPVVGSLVYYCSTLLPGGTEILPAEVAAEVIAVYDDSMKVDLLVGFRPEHNQIPPQRYEVPPLTDFGSGWKWPPG